MAAEYIGKAIVIETEEGKFNGEIHSVDVENKKLVLQKVSTSNGTKMRGLQIFFTNEILSLLVLEDIENGNDTHDEQKEDMKSTDNDETELTPNEPEINLLAKDPSDEGSRLIARQPLAPNKVLTGEENFITVPDECLLADPPPVTLIEEFGEEYDNALESIKKQRVVGVSAEGNNIGRTGTVYLVAVGCIKATYIFNVHQLGEDCISVGLKSFLENGNILKVIHDCRLLSDFLFHKYGINIVNVFDTQVADVIIYKQTRGELPRVLNRLEPCLYEYLPVNASKYTFESVIYQLRKKDPKVWTKRPLHPKLINAVAEKVLYLRELKLILTEIMLAEFLSGVDIYLAVFRDSNVDYSGQMAKINKVPKAFNWIKNAAEKRWKAFAERDRKEALASRYMPGDESKVPINPQEGVGWTEGNEFADMYSKMHGRILERDDLDSIPSMANGSQPIDTGIAPWRSTGSRALKNGNGTASSNDVIFKSETPITQATKTNKEQRSAKNALTERHQKITESPNSKAKHHTSEAEDPTAIGAGAMLRGTTDLSIDVAPAKYEYPQPAHLQSPASYASDGSQSNAVGKNIERKGPVDGLIATLHFLIDQEHRLLEATVCIAKAIHSRLYTRRSFQCLVQLVRNQLHQDGIHPKMTGMTT